jgi:hypothetical protein
MCDVGFRNRCEVKQVVGAKKKVKGKWGETKKTAVETR